MRLQGYRHRRMRSVSCLLHSHYSDDKRPLTQRDRVHPSLALKDEYSSCIWQVCLYTYCCKDRNIIVFYCVKCTSKAH
uniref:Uncharacterized protein n=1 Tax=Anguilla anguilla TaxID=7936 RepID=A0A0E9PA44_ANGAN